ncbi:MAG TPA: hypothetical protein DET40_15670 [Lentisphaeria bacterium]|nr:MAG: hypothetical protein A2X45_14195 [Lentisphaerae bacterium GWF2_50_93]HCE44978.1 hypothetical protein [Lentisphaeria bacterium]
MKIFVITYCSISAIIFVVGLVALLNTELMPMPGNVPEEGAGRMEFAELVYDRITCPAHWAGHLKIILAPLIWALPLALLIVSLWKLIKPSTSSNGKTRIADKAHFIILIPVIFLIKLQIFTITCLLFSGCSTATIKMSDLRQSDNLYYLGDSSTPFTGSVPDRLSGCDYIFIFKEGKRDDMLILDGKGNKFSMNELGKAFNKAIEDGRSEIAEESELEFLCETEEATYYSLMAATRGSSSLFSTVKRVGRKDGSICYSKEARTCLKSEKIVRSRPGFKGFALEAD